MIMALYFSWASESFLLGAASAPRLASRLARRASRPAPAGAALLGAARRRLPRLAAAPRALAALSALRPLGGRARGVRWRLLRTLSWPLAAVSWRSFAGPSPAALLAARPSPGARASRSGFCRSSRARGFSSAARSAFSWRSKRSSFSALSPRPVLPFWSRRPPGRTSR